MGIRPKMSGGDDDKLGPLDEKAHAWIRLLASGEATAADAEALKRWCALSPEHAAAFAAASQFWQAMGPAGQSLINDDRVASVTGARRSRILVGRRAVLGGALAASAAGIMIARPPFSLWPSFSELSADYRTGAGEQREVALGDGVSVQMNSRTSISLANDVIELVAGEASFSRKSDRSAGALEVVAAGGRVATTNGRFDLRRFQSGACVTCLENEVSVAYQGQKKTFRAGERVNYGEDGLSAAIAVDPDVATAWRKGMMIFKMTPLAEVVEELNRYRSGHIILLNGEKARAPVNGQFRIDKPDEALLQLEQAFDIKSRVLPGGLVLLS